MGFESAFLEFMPHGITVYEYSGFDLYGEPSYSTSGSTFPAMIEERPDLIRTSFGDEVVSSHVVYVASTSRIALTSRVKLHAGGSTEEPPLVRADAFSDTDGIHHVVLFFGSGSAGG